MPPTLVLIAVVNPWIRVESRPGSICHTLCGVPGFWFSSTIGFVLVAAAVVGVVLAASAKLCAVVVLDVGATGELMTCEVVPGVGVTDMLVNCSAVGAVAGGKSPDEDETVLGALVPVNVVPPCNTVVDAGAAADGGVLEPIG